VENHKQNKLELNSIENYNFIITKSLDIMEYFLYLESFLYYIIFIIVLVFSNTFLNCIGYLPIYYLDKEIIKKTHKWKVPF
jgi:hypothetical protein